MKKVLSKISLLTLALLILGISGLFMSCEGPAGPAGTNGKDGNATCGACHNSTAANFNLKWSQFELSRHNTGTIYESESGNLACDGCHTSEGFIEAASLGVNDPTSQGTGKLTCRTCHFIHTKYDSTDFNLRISAPFALRQTGVTVDFAKGTICAKCHQARPYTRGAQADTVSPSGTGTFSRFGPHYGVVANVVTMNGPVQIAGSATYPSANPHAGLTKGCVTCHMGQDTTNPAVGGHTFKLPVANLSKLSTISTCANSSCHDAKTIQNYATIKQITTDIATYRSKLIAKGFLDTTQTVSADGYNVLGEYFSAPKKGTIYKTSDADVTLNYLYLAKDRSNGVHNPLYVQALVKNALDYLNQ